MFPVTSRYHGIEIAKIKLSDGREVAYLRRRFVPRDAGTLIAEHVIAQEERLDRITAQYLGDPEQFWRVADANDAMHPESLTTAENIGRSLRIPLPTAQGRI